MRRLAPLVLMLALALVAPSCGGDPVNGTMGTATTIVSDVDLSCSKPGVVRPNCGTKPEDAGDRGGWLQYLVWALLVVGLVIVFTIVFRSAKRTETNKRVEVGDRNWS